MDSLITDTGTISVLREKAPEVPLYWLDSLWLTPALTDGHAHLLAFAFEPAQPVPLLHSRDSFLAWLARQKPNRGEVLYVRGWDESRWNGKPLTRKHLDQVCPAVPVLAVRIDGHIAVSNSAFLQKFPPPLSLRPLVDQKQGIWKEEALTWVLSHLPPAPFFQALDRLLAFQDTLRRLGIGAVVEMGLPARLLPYLTMLDTVSAWQTFVDVYVEASSEAIHQLCPPSSDDAFPRYGRTYAIRGFKLYADGSLGARTACLRQPYRNTTQYGVCRLTQKELRRWAQIARTCSLSLAIHVIGDRPLDTLRTAFPGDSPPVPHARIEHLQVVPQEALVLFRNGWLPSVQPCHWLTDQRWLAERLPPNYPALLYPYHFLMQFPWCIGTDFPVEPWTPARNFKGAVDRTPDTPYLRVWMRVLAGYTLYNRRNCVAPSPLLTPAQEVPPAVLKPGVPATFVAITPPSRTNPWYVRAFWRFGKRIYPP